MRSSDITIGLLAGSLAWPLAQAAGSGLATTSSCEPALVQTIPHRLIGMPPDKAKKWLRDNGYVGPIHTVVLPFQTKRPERVVSTNPHEGVKVCGETPLWLNVGPPTSPVRMKMRDVRGKRPAEAMKLLQESLAASPKTLELIACGHAMPMLPAPCDDQFSVVQQWPPPGTELDPKSAPVSLQLKRLGAPPLPGTEVATACTQVEPTLAWKFTYEAPVPLLVAMTPHAVRVVVRRSDPVLDSLACTAHVMSVATPVFDATPEPPPAELPIAPALLGGILGGGLLARFWPRGRGTASVSGVGAAPASTAPAPPSVRVLPDVPRPRV